MRDWRREGFYAGLGLALAIGLFLMWLWGPVHQVRLHSQNLLRAIERKNWVRAEEFIAPDYQDQWHNDRALLLERTREVFHYLRNVRLMVSEPAVEIGDGSIHWRSRISVSGDPGELMTAIQERVNSLSSPFDLEWRHASGKPWDWKLVRVTNPALAIREFAE